MPRLLSSPFYAEYLMQNSRLDQSQAGIKTAGRSIDSLRHADGTTLMGAGEEQLKNGLMRVKEEREKAGLKLNIQETKATGSVVHRREELALTETSLTLQRVLRKRNLFY